MRHSIKGAVGVFAAVSVGLVPAVSATPTAERTRLPRAVTLEGIREHQKALQGIADANGGTRAAGTPGYDASAKYVFDRLDRAGFDPEYQEFEFDYFAVGSPSTLAQVAPSATTYSATDDFATLTFSGAGDVTAAVTAVDVEGATSGCEAEDFAGFAAGTIALVKRGTCTFGVKATNAQAAGAAAVLIYNDGTAATREGPVAGTLGEPFSVPVLGPSFAVGTALAAAAPAGLQLRVVTDTVSEKRTTVNVLAETKTGAADEVVVVGAHLDSVAAGPGINDNGSGSATILEVAEQLRKARGLKNKVRFAFWGAEELGLIGSEYYVENLTDAEREAIALNLNFDMLGSPNYVRFIYDGDNSAFPVGPAAAVGPAGSGAIERVFKDYFDSRYLASAETPFSGRSDYGPFIAAGIPAGGLFSGAEGVKTEAEAVAFGGRAGVAYDPCYHLACDTFDNVSLQGLDEMADAVAHTVETFGRSTAVLTAPVPAAAGAGVAGSGGGGLHDADEDHQTS